MKDEIDIYETTPTYPKRLEDHPPDWYEVPSKDGKWVYVMRKKRGDEFTVYRYPKPDERVPE